MNRLTSDKDVKDMGMVELAYNSCYAKDGRAMYRDFDSDVDARQLAIQLLEIYADIPNEFTSDDDFDDRMIEYMSYGIENPEGMIALFYRNLLAMADLRERLKRYEDTGLTPEEMMAMEREFYAQAKELMEYHKIGTIEDLREAKTAELSSSELAQIAVRRLREYEAIGTIEECREALQGEECQEAMEKQKAKKPVKDEHNYECCPRCGWIVHQDKYGGRYLPHCKNCGQVIDWD